MMMSRIICQDIVLSFLNLLAFIYKKPLTKRNIKNEVLEKVIISQKNSVFANLMTQML